MSDLWVVCGSREWPEDKLWFVTAVMIDVIPHGALVVTGGAPGVDRWAHKEAIRLKWPTDVMKANWRPGGVFDSGAGFRRNTAMVERARSVGGSVLAFKWRASRGTAHTISEAKRLDVPFLVFTDKDMRPDIAALDTDFEPITLPGFPRV